MKRIFLTLIVIVALGIAANAEYYKCVTSNGKTIFTDSPPADAKCEFKEWINSFSESPEYVNSMRDEADYRMQIIEEKRAKVRVSKEIETEREQNAKKLELKQRELDLKEREINANTNQTPSEYITVIHDTKNINVGKHSSGHKDHKQKELDSRTGKNINEQRAVTGQAPKNIIEENTVKPQQIVPSQQPPLQKQRK